MGTERDKTVIGTATAAFLVTHFQTIAILHAPLARWLKGAMIMMTDKNKCSLGTSGTRSRRRSASCLSSTSSYKDLGMYAVLCSFI